MDYQFKDFLFNENKVYLAQRIGDVLNALHSLREESKGMGTRQIVVHAERIANQIRGIIRGNWSKDEIKTLKILQRVGIAIIKNMEEKEEWAPMLSSVIAELEQLTGKTGVPINNLASPNPDNP
jgi:hypothetical protein